MGICFKNYKNSFFAFLNEYFLIEKQSNTGGSGWLSFRFFIFQGAAALVIIGVRLVIWIGQLFL